MDNPLRIMVPLLDAGVPPHRMIRGGAPPNAPGPAPATPTRTPPHTTAPPTPDRSDPGRTAARRTPAPPPPPSIPAASRRTRSCEHLTLLPRPGQRPLRVIRQPEPAGHPVIPRPHPHCLQRLDPGDRRRLTPVDHGRSPPLLPPPG